MTTHHARRILPTIAIAALAVALTGCAGPGSPASSSTATAPSTPSASRSASTQTAPPTVTPTPASAASGAAAPAPGGSTSAGSASTGRTSAGSAAGSAASGSRCATAQLTGSIADGGGGASAGAQRVAIVLRNTGARACTLQGWPGVSFVGGGNGTQIGNAATLDRATPHPTLSIRPGGEVQAIVTVEAAGNWDSATCHPRVTDGFRVIPPGSRQSLFVGASGSLFESCASTSVHQLTTSAIAAI
jgi:hypothetical protein